MKYLFLTLIIFNLCSCSESFVRVKGGEGLDKSHLGELRSTWSIKKVDGQEYKFPPFTSGYYELAPGFHKVEWKDCFSTKESMGGGYNIERNSCSDGTTCFESKAGERYNFEVRADGSHTGYWAGIKDNNQQLIGGDILYFNTKDKSTHKHCDCETKTCGATYQCAPQIPPQYLRFDKKGDTNHWACKKGL